jgi:predicted RecA/RadA family phage recombinase
MALNEAYANGESLNYAVNENVESGDFVVLGGIVGVAETSAREGSDGNHYATLRHIGVFTGTTSDAVTVGAAIYLASEATYGTALTTSDGGEDPNKLVGYAIKAKGAVAGDVFVRINN